MSNKLQISDLIVTQNDLAEPEQLQAMIRFVQQGGFFTLDLLERHEKYGYHTRRHNFSVPAPIQINRTEDGRLWIHNGHHRISAIFLGGRGYLLPEEYQLSHYTYAQYEEINLPDDYLTPFSLYAEVRLNDFSAYRQKAHEIWSQQDETATICFIRDHRHAYCCPRPVGQWKINELPYVRECLERGSVIKNNTIRRKRTSLTPFQRKILP